MSAFWLGRRDKGLSAEARKKRLDAQPCAEISQTGSSYSKRASPFLDKRPCPNHECKRETWTQLFSAENTRSDLFSLAEAYNAHITGMCIRTILD